MPKKNAQYFKAEGWPCSNKLNPETLEGFTGCEHVSGDSFVTRYENGVVVETYEVHTCCLLPRTNFTHCN
jgi:hypothetical protein